MIPNGPGERYVSDELLDARYFKALDRFDIRFAPAMWVYDNVRAGADVLHLGCGPGTLALLKRKGVTLTGVDGSSEAARTARRNGYDAAYQADLAALPFGNDAFDYVISLDVFSLQSEQEERAVLTELKRVLRKDGATLHSIECNDAAKDADEATRFRKVFRHVAVEPRDALGVSTEDFLAQDGG